MTVVFDVNEEVEMRYFSRGRVDNDLVTLAYEPVNGGESTAVTEGRQPHINKLYEDLLERIEASPKHPITYDIQSFARLD